MKWIIPIFIVLPAMEIGVLLLSGKTFGIGITVGLIILTGVAGAYLAKQQGLETIRSVRRQLEMGQPPGDLLLDGLCILFGAAFLLTPGFITDVAGFYLLLPPTRKTVKPLLKTAFMKWIDRRTITIIR
ncbi:FxsA family protein [Fervidibacillus halotolerans]|uniref:Membrane protein FxsA n=1 Tax=Fervidibacillus halotolerans TaxID=2980027 RepID=A0A9E8LZP6_9BACI|nr:FxsA family protein [Fervidibacillus halotolerans]WAA11664.1 membrane protein FxsA [Fervidibacillus halotolerans]